LNCLCSDPCPGPRYRDTSTAQAHYVAEPLQYWICEVGPPLIGGVTTLYLRRRTWRWPRTEIYFVQLGSRFQVSPRIASRHRARRKNNRPNDHSRRSQSYGSGQKKHTRSIRRQSKSAALGSGRCAGNTACPGMRHVLTAERSAGKARWRSVQYVFPTFLKPLARRPLYAHTRHKGLRIHEQTEKGDNDTVKLPTGETIKIDGKLCADR
jgi:hypothetical protein